MAESFPAYSGNGSYAFICYSHEDSPAVYPIIERLSGLGFNIWYDEGVPLDADFGGVLYERIMQCSLFVLFVSPSSAVSEAVDAQASHAISFNKDVVQIVLERGAQPPPSIAFPSPAAGRPLSANTGSKEFWRQLFSELAPCGEPGAAAAAMEALEAQEAAARSAAARRSAKRALIAAACVVVVALVGLLAWRLAFPTITVGGRSVSVGVTELDLSGMGLADKDVAKLSRCSELTALDLSGNRITDLAPLATLSELAELRLDGNPLDSLDDLLGAADSPTALERVYCSGCGLDDEYLHEVNTTHPDTEVVWTLSIAGEEYSTDAETLNLFNRALEDISFIRYFGHLTRAYLGGNAIADLSPLAELPGLTYLDLNRNSISDLSPLESLTGLTELRVSGNPLANPDSLLRIAEALPQVERVYCSDCGLADEALHRANTALPDTELIWTLSFGGKTFSSDVTTLDLSGGFLSDISPLRYATRLTALDLSNNRITDLEALAGLTGLTELDLGGNQISSLAPLAELTGLTVLDLSGNRIEDLSPLAGLTELRVLDLGFSPDEDAAPPGNDIADLSPLAGLTRLTSLDLASNKVTDLSPLAELTGLTSLCLGRNSIADLAPLSGLTELTHLELAFNRIADISALASLTKLNHLWLGGSESARSAITDIAPLAALRELTDLYLIDIRVTDISPLLGLEKLDHLCTVRSEMTLDDITQLKTALPGCELSIS